ncbi:tRNA lysidine(34) synthetase TilS [Paracoccus sp. MC1854]|uniref:tRNA lysidine(34) synthetase TilS n=1 Tax=Paracoccus sp. MC1854 TaxID=2760306 RepID=UPI0016049F44|nr:tRNA lysidine(34) synthetase TilS [Paracoccus sp. MC1854]MBB1491125.1 tRNA lysidine(34) synthetase TilS [Paracoccus sp. MC1854]
MAAEPQDLVSAELDRLAGDLPALGIAVSGGGDSMALLHMAHAWGTARGVRIEAATVDHRLRAESATEAAHVAAMAAALGIPHAVLAWRHQGGTGNLMDAARRARLRLLADWARDGGLGAVALGHTQDDQAETLLMRLARGAGIDGLSAMAAARDHDGIRWMRPMLGLRRPALREWLAQRNVGWIDDPTNEDAAYDRVRARQAIRALELPVEALARSAAHLAEARAALAEAAVAAADGVEADRGTLRLPRRALSASPEIRRRLVTAALRWVTGADYPPRGEDVGRLIGTLAASGQGTLDGVIARVKGEAVEFLREPAAAVRSGAARPEPCPPGVHDEGRVHGVSAGRNEVFWDRRWRLTGLPDGAVVTAATEASLAGRDWRASGLARLALASSPAVRIDGRVILPLLDPSPVRAMPLRGVQDFLAILRAH